MNTLKKVIRRTSSNKKFYSPTTDHSTISSIPPLLLFSHDLSPMERPLFEMYWQELDPFDIGKVSLYCILSFLTNCKISEQQQIVRLFDKTKEWNQAQVYAMLRLVSHIKHGRKLNADLIYLPGKK
ncbi:uncharacterized protein BX664DRAFT_262225, partial [Halteromyces radiatus]|uniref:uncharacterized protein n=1 Tax=Halteromyces radiatus TaxID=101107 RepID=UPI0022211010